MEGPAPPPPCLLLHVRMYLSGFSLEMVRVECVNQTLVILPLLGSSRTAVLVLRRAGGLPNGRGRLAG